jgi:hypothetical protein
MTDETVQHILMVGAVWSYKIVTLLVGYLFAKLGFALFLKGVTGEFRFQMEVKGAKADLMSASPGLFLMLMGTIIVGVGLYKGMDVAVRVVPGPSVQSGEYRPAQRPVKPELPRIGPPFEEKSDEAKKSH